MILFSTYNFLLYSSNLFNPIERYSFHLNKKKNLMIEMNWGYFKLSRFIFLELVTIVIFDL